MIEQATVDAYGNSEQITSWFTSSPMATLLCDSQSKIVGTCLYLRFTRL